MITSKGKNSHKKRENSNSYDNHIFEKVNRRLDAGKDNIGDFYPDNSNFITINNKSLPISNIIKYIGICKEFLDKDPYYDFYSQLIEDFFIEEDGIGNDFFRLKKDTILTNDIEKLSTIQKGMKKIADNLSKEFEINEKDRKSFENYIKGVRYMILKHILFLIKEHNSQKYFNTAFKLSKMISDELEEKFKRISLVKKNIDNLHNVQNELKQKLDNINNNVNEQSKLLSEYIEKNSSKTTNINYLDKSSTRSIPDKNKDFTLSISDFSPTSI
jgi:hypothetical protein